MDRRDLNRIGRCCARCKTPFMCAKPTCGCHGSSSAQCGFCGDRLFVPPPRPLSIRDILTHRLADAA